MTPAEATAWHNINRDFKAEFDGKPFVLACKNGATTFIPLSEYVARG